MPYLTWVRIFNMLMLLFDAFGQMRQIQHGAFDLAMGRFKLAVAHQRRGRRQPPTGTVGDCDYVPAA